MSIVRMALRAIRGVLFLILYWLRMPLHLLCNLLSVPFLFLFLFAYFFMLQRREVWMSFGVVSFGSFALMWGYDRLLIKLAPDDVMAVL